MKIKIIEILRTANLNPKFSGSHKKKSIQDYLLVKKLDVFLGRLQGSHNNFHWQLGGNFNDQPCSRKQLKSFMHKAGQCCFELLALISSPKGGWLKLLPNCQWKPL